MHTHIIASVPSLSVPRSVLASVGLYLLTKRAGSNYFMLLSEHLLESNKTQIVSESHGVDPALFSINWFLCLFVDSLPVNTYLHIWDAFLFEGSKVRMNSRLLMCIL